MTKQSTRLKFSFEGNFYGTLIDSRACRLLCQLSREKTRIFCLFETIDATSCILQTFTFNQIRAEETLTLKIVIIHILV